MAAITRAGARKPCACGGPTDQRRRRVVDARPPRGRVEGRSTGVRRRDQTLRRGVLEVDVDGPRCGVRRRLLALLGAGITLALSPAAALAISYNRDHDHAVENVVAVRAREPGTLVTGWRWQIRDGKAREHRRARRSPGSAARDQPQRRQVLGPPGARHRGQRGIPRVAVAMGRCPRPSALVVVRAAVEPASAVRAVAVRCWVARHLGSEVHPSIGQRRCSRRGCRDQEVLREPVCCVCDDGDRHGALDLEPARGRRSLRLRGRIRSSVGEVSLNRSQAGSKPSTARCPRKVRPWQALLGRSSLS